MHVINSSRNSQGLAHKNGSDTRESVLALRLCLFEMEARFRHFISKIYEVKIARYELTMKKAAITWFYFLFSGGNVLP